MVLYQTTRTKKATYVLVIRGEILRLLFSLLVLRRMLLDER